MRAAVALANVDTSPEDVRTAHETLTNALASVEHDRSVRCVDEAIRVLRMLYAEASLQSGA